jgi:hypothetical protein
VYYSCYRNECFEMESMKNDAVGSDDEEGILVLALGLSLSHQGLGLGPHFWCTRGFLRLPVPTSS